MVFFKYKFRYFPNLYNTNYLAIVLCVYPNKTELILVSIYINHAKQISNSSYIKFWHCVLMGLALLWYRQLVQQMRRAGCIPYV